MENLTASERNECVERIAEDFAKGLAEALGPKIMAEIVRRNKEPDYQRGACATHDFCDANMYMLASFEAIMGREPDCGLDDDASLVNGSWDHARTLFPNYA